MPYEVLARRWRPQLFQDVIGQEHITHTLMNAIKADRLAHAYLFSGARGVGKTSVARIFAKAMACEQGEPGIPCNKCRSCVEITDGSSVDVREIDGASNRGIDEIRELRENIKYLPSSTRYRIYIIDEVHMLTIHAFNALLKTLEEPPSHVKFIFATTESHKVPVTILSRCQRFDFKRIPLPQIASHLERIAKEEGIEITGSGMGIIAREAEGSMRDAESLMDQVVSFAGHKVSEQDITDILGIIDRDIVFESSAAIIQGSADKCLEIVDKICTYGYDVKEFYRTLMGQFRNLLISLISPQNNLLDMNENDRDAVRRQAEMAGEEKLRVLLNYLINREEDLRFTFHPRLILEATMIRLCHLGDFLSFGDLIKKIESLEKRLVNFSAQKGESVPERISDPGVDWDQENQKGAGRGTNRTGEDRKGWDDFLVFLSSKSKVMHSILKDWQLLKLTDDTLEIAGTNRSFSSGYFDDQGRYDQLKNFCREFFGRSIRIEIPVNHQVRAEKGSKVKETAADTAKASILPRNVQGVLDLFDGEIISGNPADDARFARPLNTDKEVVK